MPVKSLVDEDFKDELTRYWKARGFGSESDFIRECLMVAVLGQDAVERMHLDRIRLSFGNKAGIGTEA